MIASFKNQGTQDIFNGRDSKQARKVCPSALWPLANRKLDLLDSAVTLEDLRIPPGNRLEALKGDRQGQHSIRINSQYRICFVWSENSTPTEVEIIDYHS
ncbi:MAG: type II toxin-antitoxin system RelE/ParE family toxin [Merismopediaceae bacterium]|nr:type II toxin-antitoxin system RelE/ParE family toxin [Merismopediaceae bacterium]